MEVSAVNLQDYNARPLLQVTITLLVITSLNVLMRCFVRIRIIRIFTWSDWFMIGAQTLYSANAAVILLGIYYGMGWHDLAVPEEKRVVALMYQYISIVIYPVMTCFIKLSIATFLLGIAVQRRYIYPIWTSIVIVGLWCIVILFYNVFECTPFQANWDYRIPHSYCLSFGSFESVAYSISIMTIVTDWFYALLPILMIWNLNMTKQEKGTVSFILSLGIFTSVATSIRLRYLMEINTNADTLFSATQALVWTIVECGIAISAASLVTIRPLLRALNITGFETRDEVATQHTPARNIISSVGGLVVADIQGEDIRLSSRDTLRDIEQGWNDTSGASTTLASGQEKMPTRTNSKIVVTTTTIHCTTTIDEDQGAISHNDHDS